MFGSKVEKALSDWPKDNINAKKGTVQFSGQYATPGTVSNVVIVSMIIAIPLAIVTAGIGLAFLIPLVPFLWMMFQKNLKISMDEDVIRVNGRKYDRKIPIEFRVDHHHKAERDKQFRDALEVIMQYGEKRIVVAEMRGKDVEKAKALALRLQAWNHSFAKIMASHQEGHGFTQMANPVEAKKDDFGAPPDVI